MTEPKPETLVDWIVWVVLWPVVAGLWVIVAPFAGMLYIYSSGTVASFSVSD